MTHNPCPNCAETRRKTIEEVADFVSGNHWQKTTSIAPAIRARFLPKSPAQLLAEECPHGMTEEQAQWVLDREKLKYEGDVIDAVQTLLERGRAHVDKDGYLVNSLTDAAPREIEVIGADIDEPADGPHEQRLRDQRKILTESATAPRYVFGPWVIYDEHHPKDCIEIDVGHAPGTYRRAYRLNQSYLHDGGECPLADGGVEVEVIDVNGNRYRSLARLIYWITTTSFTPLDQGSGQ